MASAPPGWAMWGPDESKKPANDTRDTTNPHSGAASLRLFHPANGGGYIASDPNGNSFRPAKNGAYRVTFWARADKPSTANFQVQALSHRSSPRWRP